MSRQNDCSWHASFDERMELLELMHPEPQRPPTDLMRRGTRRHWWSPMRYEIGRYVGSRWVPVGASDHRTPSRGQSEA